MRYFYLFFLFYLLTSKAVMSQSTFKGGTSTNWTDPNNWDPIGVPSSGTEIIIATIGGNNPIIPAGNYSYSKITINDGKELTINAGAEVTITGSEIWNLGKLYVSGKILGTGTNTLLKNGSTFSSSVDEITFYNSSELNISGKVWNINGTITTNNSTISSLSIENGLAPKHSTIIISNNTTIVCNEDIKNIYGDITISNSDLTLKSLTNNANDETFDQVINLADSHLTLTGSIEGSYSVKNSGILNVSGTSTIDPGTKYLRNGIGSKMNIQSGSTLIITQNKLWNFGNLEIDGNISGTFNLSNGSTSVSSGTININTNSTINITGTIYNIYGSINATSPTTFNCSKLALNENQTINLTTTTATITDAVDNSGTINVNTNSTLNSTNEILVRENGIFNNQVGATTSVSNGQFSILNTGTLNNYGIVSANAYVNNAGTINLYNNSTTTGSTVNNKANAVINFNAVNNITGNITNNDGGLLNTTNGSTIVVSGSFINNSDLSNTFIGGSGKSVVLQVGGTFSNNTVDSKFNIESSNMSIGGDFNNKGEFTLESSATSTSSLIVGGISTNSGTLNIQRYLHNDGSGNGKWQIVSSPVSSEESKIFTGHFLNKYIETTGEFEALFSKTEPLEIGEGYISKLDFNNSDGDGVTDKANPIIFSNSILNTDNVTLSLGITADEGGNISNTYFDLPVGFHLVGNPYTSNIDWDEIYNEGSNGSNITKYLYYYTDGTTSSDPNHTTPVKNGWQVYEGGTSGAERIIAMGQGFGVVMSNNSSAKTFTIPKTSKTHNSGTFNKKGNSDNDSFVLNAISNNIIDDIKLRFNEKASDNYDNEFDAYKIKSFGNSPTPYFLSNDGIKLAISEMPFSETVDLGFSMKESGEVTFYLNDVYDFSEIILEDKLESNFTNLINNPYTFNYSTDESETGRFKLHFKKQVLSDIDYLSDIDIYTNQGIIFINSNKILRDVEIKIYSISGEIVYFNKFSNLSNKKINTSLTGIYIIKIVSDEGITTSKITLNK